jgi:aminoglycoside 3-N-acetyltransferase
VSELPTEARTTEHQVVTRTSRPATKHSLLQDLVALGLEAGDTVIVHSSLSKLGWVVGGAQTVVESLCALITSEGTIIMPTHSSNWTEPAQWSNPPLPQEWLPEIYAALPAFDPAITPTTAMGAVVECFRHVPGVARSNHPWASFAAWGRHTNEVTQDHRLEEGMGEHSPLARAYDLDARVLLLGVDHGNNSSLHLCEHRAEWVGKRREIQGAAIMVDGTRSWVHYEHLAPDSDDFVLLGDDFDATGQTNSGTVGVGPAKLMDVRPLVDFGTEWMQHNRPGSLAGPCP